MKAAARKTQGESTESVGEKLFYETLQFVMQRSPKNKSLRKLSLSPEQFEALKQEAESFLKLYEQTGLFEKDNFEHVQRLVNFSKKYREDLKKFFDVDSKDLELLALLHDLGKSLICSEIYEFLIPVFQKNDFVNLRVIPHELYSMVWIQRVCARLSIPLSAAHEICDQIANHNLGPNLGNAENKFLKEKYSDGCYKHWWVERWSRFAKALTANGIPVSSEYGYAESPLANLLVLFDRVDGCSLQAWEKYLNQDWLSGELPFSISTVTHLLEESYQNAKEQLEAIGKNLKAYVSQQQSLDTFVPYRDATQELEKSHRFLKRLIRSNQKENFKKLNLSSENQILFEREDKVWLLAKKTSGQNYALLRKNGLEWLKVSEFSNPVEILFSFLADIC